MGRERIAGAVAVACAWLAGCGSDMPVSRPPAPDAGDARAEAGVSADAISPPDARPIADALPDVVEAGPPPAPDAGFGRPAGCAPRVTLANQGGTVLTDWELVVITPSGDAEASTSVGVMNAIAGSAWLRDQTAAYGSRPPAATLAWTGPALSPTTSIADALTDAEVRSYVAALVRANPPANRPRLHALLLPAGVQYVAGSALNGANCAVQGGYHSYYVDANVPQIYAVVARCEASAPESPDRVRSTIASHEVIEAVTDPYGDGFRVQDGSSWARSGGSSWIEDADLCEGTRVEEDGLWYQRNWSITSAAGAGDPCSPASPDGYYSVCAAVDWTPIPAGGQASIALHPWSTGPVADWRVGGAAAWVSSTAVHYTWQLSSPRTLTIGSTTLPLVNVGEALTVNVTVGADAPSGFAVVLSLFSTRRKADGTFADTGDIAHEERLGFYVP